MKARWSAHGTEHQSGVSLVEVMVALSLGLLILVSIGGAYIHAMQLSRQREDMTLLVDPARVGFDMLRHNLMHAGYVDWFDQTGTPSVGIHSEPTNTVSASTAIDKTFNSLHVFPHPDETLLNVFHRVPGAAKVLSPLTLFYPGVLPVFGCDGAMQDSPANVAAASMQATSPTSAAAPVPSCGTAHPTRQTLQVAFQAQPMHASHGLGSLNMSSPESGEGLDCLQQKPPAVPGQRSGLVINRFFLASSSVSGVRQLRCAGSGGSNSEDLASGVEELVFRYQLSGAGNPGTRTAAGGGSPSAFMTATAVSGSAEGWPSVSAVEVCMVLATPSSTGSAATGTVQLQQRRPTCERGTEGAFKPDVQRTAGDNRLWKRSTTVVGLRNVVFATTTDNAGVSAP